MSGRQWAGQSEGAGWLAPPRALAAPASAAPCLPHRLSLPARPPPSPPSACLRFPCHLQVRQKLYGSSVLRYRQYARHLAPMLRPMRPLILRYERDAGLESSEHLLAQVLDGAAEGREEL